PRLAAAVLASVAAPLGPSDPTAHRRAGLNQLGVIEADVADKVKALVTAMGDGVLLLDVVKALGGYGKDAVPALPLLRKLKMSPDDALGAAAPEAIRKIE